MSIQFYYYVPTITLTVVLALIVIVNNPRRLTNRVFAIFSLGILLWLLSQFVADMTTDSQVALFSIRTTVALSLWIGSAFIWLIDALVSGDRFNAKYYWANIILSIILVPFAYLPSTVVSVNKEPWGAEATYGSTYLIFLLYAVVIFLFTLYLAFGRRTQKDARSRLQVRFIYTGIAATLIANVLTNFVLIQFGLPQELGVAIGVSSVIFIVGFTGFAILKHRLFNIRSVVARSLAYLLSVLVFTLIYGFVAFGLAQSILLNSILTTQRSQQIFNVILAVLLAFTFPAIRRFFQKITDQIFYRDRYDPQALVSDIGRILASEIELKRLSTKVLDIMQAQMRLENTNIVVMGQEGIFYQTHDSNLHQMYHPHDLDKFKTRTTITYELPDGDKRDILERHNVRAILPLKTKESFVGYLLLGEKKSGDIFTSEDIQTLRIIADELAVAIQNARSFQEIQTFNATLREKVQQATVELRHANRELKDLDKAKDEFISMASHQLRTPLTAVRGYTSMVMDGDFGKVSKEQNETLKQAFDAATRMGRLVDDLLNVSRIQSGKFRIERTPVDLNEILPQEVALLETTASSKAVAVAYHPPAKPVPALSIDEGKTRQALMNLMDNAIYYSSTASDGGKVNAYLESDDKFVSFRVVDNGIGVPKDQQAKLFKKFYRAPNAQKTRPDGTGLGLFLVGKVVQGQGGEIIFESAEGKGSTFGFKLPIKSAGDGLEGAGTEAIEKPAATPETPDQPVVPTTPEDTKATPTKA